MSTMTITIDTGEHASKQTGKLCGALELLVNYHWKFIQSSSRAIKITARLGVSPVASTMGSAWAPKLGES